MGVTGSLPSMASGSVIERKVENDKSFGDQSRVDSLVLGRQSTSSKFSPRFSSFEVHPPPQSSS